MLAMCTSPCLLPMSSISATFFVVMVVSFTIFANLSMLAAFRANFSTIGSLWGYWSNMTEWIYGLWVRSSCRERGWMSQWSLPVSKLVVNNNLVCFSPFSSCSTQIDLRLVTSSMLFIGLFLRSSSIQPICCSIGIGLIFRNWSQGINHPRENVVYLVYYRQGQWWSTLSSQDCWRCLQVQVIILPFHMHMFSHLLAVHLPMTGLKFHLSIDISSKSAMLFN